MSDAAATDFKLRGRTPGSRLLYALVNSLHGLRYLARNEAAFRQELILLVASVPGAIALGENAAHGIMLIASIVLVLTIEAVNSAIEAVCDAISTEYDVRIKTAKDCGSLAVLLAMVVAGSIWGSALWTAY